MIWHVTRRGPRAEKHTKTGEVVPGPRGLQAFLDACEVGKPGIYRLEACGCVLAEAEVTENEINVTWHREWVFYALGRDQRSDQVEGVVAFFREQS